MAALVEQPARDTFMTRPQVEASTGFKHSWLYQKIQEGKFPKPYRIGSRAVRWSSAEVHAWIDAQRTGGLK